MKLKSISSSSRGNLHILENEDTTILLDCGIKFDRISKELNSLTIDGVLITHEHGDHVNGCDSLSRNKQTKFYSTEEALIQLSIPSFMGVVIQPYKKFKIGSFDIVAFEVKHDALHPVNYLIKDTNTNAQLLYITDTGYIHNLEFKDIDYILIECNFDEEWFNKSELTKTEEIKKRRLLSKDGHLSIQKTKTALNKIINHNTKKIILCHISYSFDNYKEFEKEIKSEFPNVEVKALNPKLIFSELTELKERKEVLIFE